MVWWSLSQDRKEPVLTVTSSIPPLALGTTLEFLEQVDGICWGENGCPEYTYRLAQGPALVSAPSNGGTMSYHPTPSTSQMLFLSLWLALKSASGSCPTQIQTPSQACGMFFSLSVASACCWLSSRSSLIPGPGGHQLLPSPVLFPVSCPGTLWALGKPTGLQLTPAVAELRYPKAISWRNSFHCLFRGQVCLKQATLDSPSFPIPSVGKAAGKPHSHPVGESFNGFKFPQATLDHVHPKT